MTKYLSSSGENVYNDISWTSCVCIAKSIFMLFQLSLII